MHPACSQVGADILRQGGNAMDAAVAMGAAISVLSPDWAGPAGDSAWLVYDATRHEYACLDGYSVCPAAANAGVLESRFGLDPVRDASVYEEEPAERRHMGAVTAMVPGTPAAWVELARRYGTIALEVLLDPAIELAESGFPVNDYFAIALAANREKLATHASSRAAFFRGDTVLGAGDRLRQPELAQTLRRLARAGHDGFYRGETASLLVEYAKDHGGLIAAADLERYRCAWRPVVRGTYRERDIIVTAPPTAGVHVIAALNILEGFDLRGLGYHTREALHLTLEALKLALADRRSAGGDPDFQEMDVARLASKEYGDSQRQRIDPVRAQPRGAQDRSASSTTHFAVVDAIGNIVSATQTIGSRFGCGDTATGTGLLLNDRTWWMSLSPGPNQVAPFHRANIGHAATIVARGGQPIATFGSPGGFGIVQYVVQVILHMIDYGLDLQRAIEAPRFKIENLNGRTGFERRLDRSVREALAAMGHPLFEYPEWSDRVGGVEGVEIDPSTRHMLGGYDPRRNSMAVGI
jgi:gamma-glutamyltranspeptidase/glutathione hydrolase